MKDFLKEHKPLWVLNLIALGFIAMDYFIPNSNWIQFLCLLATINFIGLLIFSLTR